MVKFIYKRRPREPPTPKRVSSTPTISFLTYPDMQKTVQGMATRLGDEAVKIIKRVLMEEGEAEKKRTQARLETASNYADDIYSRVKDNVHYALFQGAEGSVANDSDTFTLRFGYGEDFEGFMSESRDPGENIAKIFHLGKRRARDSKALKSDMFVKGQAGATHYFGNAGFEVGFSFKSGRKIKLPAGFVSPEMPARPRFLERAMANLEERVGPRIRHEIKIAYTDTIGPVIAPQGGMKEVSP